jgi:hypothetical protein
MIGVDITLQQSPNDIDIGEVPLKESMSGLAKSLSVIHALLKETPGKEWLDEATRGARNEMISDVDVITREVRAQIEQARKLMPLRYKYFINPLRAIWQLILK